MIIETSCDICGKKIIRRVQGKTGARYCSLDCKAEFQRRQRPVSVEWLKQKYIVEKLNTYEIAHLVNRDAKSVWNWLKGSGIPTRPRGGFTAPACFKKGHKLNVGRKLSESTKEKMRQIALADGRLPWGKNNPPAMLGVKGENHPSWKGGLTPERQSFYSSPEWCIAVKEVWKKADAKCERCGLDHRTIDRKRNQFAIHHIDSFMIRERRSDVSNLTLLCRQCHLWIHSKKNTKGDYLGKGH